MSAKTDALVILEERMNALAAGPKDQLYGEVDMAIEMCHVFGAISCDERRHYVRRRNKIFERESDELMARLDSRRSA